MPRSVSSGPLRLFEASIKSEVLGEGTKNKQTKPLCLDDSSLAAQGYMFEHLAPSW